MAYDIREYPESRSTAESELTPEKRRELAKKPLPSYNFIKSGIGIGAKNKHSKHNLSTIASD